MASKQLWNLRIKHLDLEIKSNESPSKIVKSLLVARGIDTNKKINEFFELDLNYWLEKTEIFNLKKAAKLILSEIKSESEFIIYGDYDVDGITAASILFNYIFWDLGYKKVQVFVPHRERQGYGLNLPAIEELLSKSKSLNKILITVDCGIRDEKLISELKAKYNDLKIILTDHHLPEVAIDRSNYSADIVVHPMHPSSIISPNEICACAISWLLYRELKLLGNNSSPEKYIEFVALATICDMMPLVGINRAFVATGLKDFAFTENKGLLSLLKKLKLDKTKIGTYELGYLIGPKINAVGRIAEPLSAIRLLCSMNQEKVDMLTEKLINTNIQRQELSEESYKNAIKQAEIQKKQNIIIVRSEEWEEGIVGLIAGKVLEKYNKPVIAFTKKKNANIWVGSARSIKNINIISEISKVSNLLIRFGGHSQAAGMSIKTEDFNTFVNSMIENFFNYDETKFLKIFEIDGLVDLRLASIDLVDEINKLEPFGNENSQPLFMVDLGEITEIKTFGSSSNHAKFYPKNLEQTEIEIIKFNASKNLSKFSQKVIGYLGYNVWKDKKKLQFIIKEFDYAQKTEIQ